MTLSAQQVKFYEGGNQVDKIGYQNKSVKMDIKIPEFSHNGEVSFIIELAPEGAKYSKQYEYIMNSSDLKNKSSIQLFLKKENGESDFYFNNEFKNIKEPLVIDKAREIKSRDYSNYEIRLVLMSRKVNGKEYKKDWVGNTVLKNTYEYNMIKDYGVIAKYDLGAFDNAVFSKDKSFSIPKTYSFKDRVVIYPETIDKTPFGKVEKVYAFTYMTEEHPKSFRADVLCFDKSKVSFDDLKKDIEAQLKSNAFNKVEVKFNWTSAIGRSTGIEYIYPHYFKKLSPKKGDNKKFLEKHPEPNTWVEADKINNAKRSEKLVVSPSYNSSYIYENSYIGEGKYEKFHNLIVHIMEYDSKIIVACFFDDDQPGELNEEGKEFFSEVLNGIKVY
jgi:hypothetical protein